MAEVKWIKLFVDIWDNRKIRQIETLPDGDTVLVIWLKLLTLAGNINDGGLVYFTRDIPYTDTMLAAQFKRPLETTRMALEVFQRFGMIEIVNDVMLVTNWEKYQSLEKMEIIREQTRRRVTKYRAKMAALKDTQKCVYCGEEASGVDHIIPQAKGGTNADENLVPCCKRCNQAKNDKPLYDFLNKHRKYIIVENILNEPKLLKHVQYNAYRDEFIGVTACNADVTQCNATDKEEDKEEDKEKEKRKRKKKDFIAADEMMVDDVDLTALKERMFKNATTEN